MPSVTNHIEQARHNERLYEFIKDEYPDWAVTALFYCVLHYVDAFLEYKGLSAENHRKRFQYIATISELKQLYPEYQLLYNLSINARYLMIHPDTKDLNDTYNESFKAFKDFAAKYLP